MNREFVIGAVSGILGIALGSSLTYILLKKKLEMKYKKIADEEVNSVKQSYQKLKNNLGMDKPPLEDLVKKYSEDEKKESVDLKFQEASEAFKKYAGGLIDEPIPYLDLTKAREEMEVRKSIKKSLEEKKNEPYEIEEDEYGEFDDYTCISLTKYADGIIADERDVPMEDSYRILGSTIDRDDIGVFYVRNDALHCDYEVASDLRNYTDVLRDSPYLALDIE